MKISNLRWWVIALIALATIINYIDRQALVVLWPSIAGDLYPDKTADEHKKFMRFCLLSLSFPMPLAKLSSARYSIGLAPV